MVMPGTFARKFRAVVAAVLVGTAIVMTGIAEPAGAAQATPGWAGPTKSASTAGTDCKRDGLLWCGNHYGALLYENGKGIG